MAHHEKRLRQQQCPGLPNARPGQARHQRAARQAQPCSHGDRFAHAKPRYQASAHKRANNVEKRAVKQHQPILHFVQTQHLHEYKRGRRQKGEQTAIRRRRHCRKRQKRGIAPDIDPGFKQRCRLQGLQVFLRQRFLKAQRDQCQGTAAKACQRHQRCAPAKLLGQQPAQGCASAGQHAQACQAFGHDACAVLRLIQVAHDGARTHHHRAHGGALYNTPHHQQRHGRCQHAADRCQRVGHQPTQQDGTPAKPVRQRPPDQLGAAKGQQQCAERELRHDHGRCKALGQHGQRRQIQIGGHGLNAQQHGQHQHHQPCAHGWRHVGGRRAGFGLRIGHHGHPPKRSRLASVKPLGRAVA